LTGILEIVNKKGFSIYLLQQNLLNFVDTQGLILILSVKAGALQPPLVLYNEE